MSLPLPSGAYDGRTLTPGFGWTSWVWHGKVFTGTTVVNRIGQWQFIRGTVTTDAMNVYIRYPGGLVDVLTPSARDGARSAPESTTFDGLLFVRGRPTLRFELRKAKE